MCLLPGTNASLLTASPDAPRVSALTCRLRTMPHLAAPHSPDLTSTEAHTVELEETPTFAWELQDLLNEDLYKDQMYRIPATFTSVRDYARSFVVPLMEERRAGVCAALKGIGNAPVAQVVQIEEYHPFSNRSAYIVWFEPATWSSVYGDSYSPKDGDVVLLTHRRWTCLSDMEQRGAIAIVRGDAVTKARTRESNAQVHDTSMGEF